MSQVQEIFLIGEEYEPGIVGNAEIDILLGHDTAICGEFAIRKEDGYTHCPDYCEDKNITFRELYKLNLHPLILPASHESSKRRSKKALEKAEQLQDKFVAVFILGSEFYVTRPFESENTALACVLWYALAYYS
ncbi:hypothetical protein [Acinetobacter baumannii]|uniref:hypothetical protein n=1 Tax=Acinetobacter baumannii TaxID=470 RepID=UPI0012308C60|nr:hypothetical protein [Acinetobacter baumannii]